MNIRSNLIVVICQHDRLERSQRCGLRCAVARLRTLGSRTIPALAGIPGRRRHSVSRSWSTQFFPTTCTVNPDVPVALGGDGDRVGLGKRVSRSVLQLEKVALDRDRDGRVEGDEQADVAPGGVGGVDERLLEVIGAVDAD